MIPVLHVCGLLFKLLMQMVKTFSSEADLMVGRL